MRFGVVVKESKKRLTMDKRGLTNNTVVRVDDLFGHLVEDPNARVAIADDGDVLRRHPVTPRRPGPPVDGLAWAMEGRGTQRYHSQGHHAGKGGGRKSVWVYPKRRLRLPNWWKSSPTRNRVNSTLAWSAMSSRTTMTRSITSACVSCWIPSSATTTACRLSFRMKRDCATIKRSLRIRKCPPSFRRWRNPTWTTPAPLPACSSAVVPRSSRPAASPSGLWPNPLLKQYPAPGRSAPALPPAADPVGRAGAVDQCHQVGR